MLGLFPQGLTPKVCPSSIMVDVDFRNYSMAVLRLETLDRLSTSLNPKKRLMSVDGKLRDWSGLADMARLTPDEKQKVESAYKQDYTRSIISIWCNKTGVTVQHLVEALEAMDRYDAVEDAQRLLVSDCRAAAVAMTARVTDVNALDKTNALTLQDVQALASGKPLVRYDAMVLFGEGDEDVAFGSHLIQRCEDAGLKVFVPQRDLVAGTVEHETSSKIISERCRKVIAVFSPSFLSSERNMFLTGFAQHTGIMDGKNDKIIPIILRPCNLPVQYQMYHKVVYDPRKTFVNFWDKILRVTFDLKNVPEHLKTYDFFLSNENDGQVTTTHQHIPQNTPEVEKQASADFDSVSMTDTACYDAASVMTSMTALSVGRLVDVPDSRVGGGSLKIRLPTPPLEDPSSDSTAKLKPKSKIKQLKDKFRRVGSKKASETQN